MRDKLWYNLLDVKFKSIYYDELATYYQVIDRRMNVFLALASSGSIASWAIWEEFNFIWALIIAISTVINVIKPYFPYHKYVNEISKMSAQLDNLSWEYENLWFKFDRDKINEEQCFKLYMDLKKRLNDVLKFSEETIITENIKIESKTNKLMDIYLRNDFNIQHTSNEVNNV